MRMIVLLPPNRLVLRRPVPTLVLNLVGPLEIWLLVNFRILPLDRNPTSLLLRSSPRGRLRRLNQLSP
jgi:hypothetical protein